MIETIIVIVLVDLGLLISYYILKAYWSHKEYLEMLKKPIDATIDHLI